VGSLMLGITEVNIRNIHFPSSNHHAMAKNSSITMNTKNNLIHNHPSLDIKRVFF